MNYPLARAVLGFVGERFADAEVARSGYRRFVSLDAPAFVEALKDEMERYPRDVQFSQLNLLGSHDTPRVRTMLLEDDAALRLAYLLQFTLPGAPCLYYGDEIGLTGGHDPACRGTMPWDHRDRWDDDLLRMLTRLVALRRDHEPLRRGELTVLAARGPVVVYARGGGDDRLVVAVNAGSRAAAMPSDAGLRGAYRDLLRDEDVVAGPAGAPLPPRSGRVLRAMPAGGRG
jgi:neopullulanase